MKLVYVAGPYSHPDPIENTNIALNIADAMYAESDHELVPVIPHLTAFWHLVHPHEYAHWLEYDLKILSRCDALLRLPGESSGADGEVEFAEMNGIPVFHTVSSLMLWVREGKLRRALPA